MTVEKWIDYYQLEPHPEGGFFNQVEKPKDITQKAPMSTELIWNSSGLSLYPHIRQGMCGFYIMIYGCGDAFFQTKRAAGL